MATEKDRVPLSSEASHAPMPAGAVFLSYASEDAAAAERIATALTNAGVQVWFDRDELRGGDAWDRKIRQQIKACALFIPVISRHAHDRIEGYFRLEWKLAVDRSHLIAPDQPFLLPVATDDTPQSDERIPDRFRELQWTRLPGGETPPAFVSRIQKLLVPDASTRAAAPTPSGSTVARASKSRLHPTWPSNAVLWVISALLAMGLTYLIAESLRRPQHSAATADSHKTASSTSENPSTVAAFNPPPHSIAVLPFVNMSGDKEQEYFSDGLTEELLNSLARINELQVAARTSAFSFKGKDTDIGTIARKLNVAAVLEGSVRRSSNHVRITAQLINATSGFHLWSETYDRELGDLLTLESEIATAVTGALQVALLGDPMKKIEIGGTRDPAALDAYLRGWKLFNDDTVAQEEAAIGAFSEAVRRDPKYAQAFASRSMAWRWYSLTWATLKGKDAHGAAVKAMEDALHAIELAPELAEGHLALAAVRTSQLDFKGAGEEYRQALALAPGYARAWRYYSDFAADMGDYDAAISAAHRALSLDPLNEDSLYTLSFALRAARRYQESLTPLEELRRREPNAWGPRVAMGSVYYRLGDFQRAATLCEVEGPPTPVHSCLAKAYYKLGRRADAEASRAKIYAAVGDANAYGYARTYAEWGNTAEALRWLETAWRLRDPGLESLKSDPSMDPLRKEPRFQAIERALKFPNR